MIRRRLFLAPLVALSLVAVACSGDDGGGSGTTVDPNRSPQDLLADEFLDQMDPDAAELIDGQCIRDLFAQLEDDDARMVLDRVRSDEAALPDDLDPELEDLLESISFRLFDCVVFDIEGDLDLDGIEIDPDGEGALQG